MRDTGLYPRRFVKWIFPWERTILAILTVALVPLATNVLRADGVYKGNPHSPAWRLVAQSGSESEAPDCPLLPGCPDGPGIPLPPSTELPGDKPAKAVADGSNLVDGAGAYSGLVLIPGGPFDMGSTEGQGRADERPEHRVALKAFYVAKHEVTVKEYCDFLNAQGEKSRDGAPRVRLDSPFCPIEKNGRYFQPKAGEQDKPVVCVSWYGAAEYAQWAGGRLPTSAEWEKAATLSTPYEPGDFLTVLPREDRAPVSIAIPSVRGITGIVGNVWEWCADWYEHDYYVKSSADNPAGPPLGKEKVIRGGSWASPECSKRIKNLHRAAPAGYYRTVGFRIVKD